VFVGGGQSLGGCVLFELSNFAIANSKGHDPALIERATGGLDSRSGPTGDQDSVSCRHEFLRFDGFDSNSSSELLKKGGYAP